MALKQRFVLHFISTAEYFKTVGEKNSILDQSQYFSSDIFYDLLLSVLRIIFSVYLNGIFIFVQKLNNLKSVN